MHMYVLAELNLKQWEMCLHIFKPCVGGVFDVRVSGTLRIWSVTLIACNALRGTAVAHTNIHTCMCGCDAGRVVRDSGAVICGHTDHAVGCSAYYSMHIASCCRQYWLWLQINSMCAAVCGMLVISIIIHTKKHSLVKIITFETKICDLDIIER